MKSLRLLFIMAALLPALSILAQETKPATPPAPPAPPAGPRRQLAPPPPEVTNRCILLVNAADIPADQLEAVRAYAEKDLWVKVEAIKLDAEWAALPSKAPGLLVDNRKVVVILGKGPAEGPYVLAAPDNQWAVANVPAFEKDAKPEQKEHRLRQAAMRGIGYALGLSTCQDAHCVMRLIRKQNDLSEMGSNFCGPTRRLYQNNAVQNGLRPIPKIMPKKVEQAPPAPKTNGK